MSNYYGYVSVDALMDFAHNHVNGMIDSNDIARFPIANVKDANEQQSLQEIFGVAFDRLRELAEAEREGRIRIISDWTPCAEGMPIRPEGKEIKRDWYIVTLGTGIVTLRAYEFDERSPFGYGFHEQNIIPVVAWQPLPEPYRADDTTGKADHIVDANKKVQEDAE